MNPHKGVIKNADLEDEADPVSFEDWVAEHAERIPAERVDDTDTGYAEKKRREAEARRGIIQQEQARVEDSRVPVYSNVQLSEAESASGRARSEQTDEEEETRFGLSDEEFNELRAAWEKEWKQRMRERREKARRQGYEKGYEKARTEAEEQIAELEELLHAGMDELRDERRTFYEEAEQELAELSVKIAERVLDAPLAHEMHDRVRSAVHDAIDQLAGEARTDVTLHPADFLRMQESGLMERLEESYEHLQWHSDPELEHQGNWIVESPRAALRHLKEELLREISESLGLAKGDEESDESDPGSDSP